MTPEEQTRIIDIMHRLSALLQPPEATFSSMPMLPSQDQQKLSIESKVEEVKPPKKWDPSDSILTETDYGKFPLLWKRLVESHIKRQVPFLTKDIIGERIGTNASSQQAFVTWCKQHEQIHYQWDTNPLNGKSKRRFIFIPKYWENGKWHLANLQTHYEPATIKGSPPKPIKRWVEEDEEEALTATS